MMLKSAFLPSAGFGTRMGEVGQYLAKPLWPIFEKSLLELHLLRLNSIGINQVGINVHHLHEEVKEFCN